MQTPISYQYKIYSSIKEIEIGIWNDFNQETNFYQSYQFLKIIEDSQNEIECRYCIFYLQNKIVGLAYFQLIQFSLAKLTKYNSSIKSNFISNSIRKYIAKKEIHLLHLGNVFFTGDKGVIFNNNNDLMHELPTVFDEVASTYEKKVTAYLTSNITLSDEKVCKDFPIHGFHHFDTEPDMLFDLLHRWNSFDEYSAALSSKYRIRMNKVLELSAEIDRRVFLIEDVLKYNNEIDILFKNVMQQADFNLSELNTTFFIENIKSLYHIFKMYGYFFNDKLCGFSTLYMCKGIVHVHYIGLDYEINKTHKLYNRMLLDVLRIAIENKIDKIHFGRTATEIKSTIGAKPIVLNAYLKVNNRFLNRIAPYFLKRIKVPHFVIRNPFRK
jgi:hypothetical protein